jgi:hypothetical protein
MCERFIDLTIRNFSAVSLVLAKHSDGKYSLVFLVVVTLAYRPVILVEGPAVELDKLVEGFVDVVGVEVARAVAESKKMHDIGYWVGRGQERYEQTRLARTY